MEKTKQEYNVKIAEFLLDKAKSEEGKHLRFCQMLFNYGINEFEISQELKDTSGKFYLKDKYQEESKTTYNKIKLKYGYKN